MCGGRDYPKIWGKNEPHLGADVSFVCSKHREKTIRAEVGRQREKEREKDECRRRRDPRGIVFNLGGTLEPPQGAIKCHLPRSVTISRFSR